MDEHPRRDGTMEGSIRLLGAAPSSEWKAYLLARARPSVRKFPNGPWIRLHGLDCYGV